MSQNPVYILFHSPPSFGPFFLRMALAAVFFFQGMQKTFGWFGGEGWDATVAAWSDPAGMNVAYTLIVLSLVTELIVAGAFFLGLFTRVAGLAVLAMMSTTLFYYINGGSSFQDIQLPFLLLACGLSLTCIGGGIFSIDRGISSHLLPIVG